jgi:amino acid transporter
MLSKTTLNIAFFVIGNVIGSGFFMMPALLAPLGSNILYSWMVAGSIAFIYSYIFGKLYTTFPDSSVMSDYFQNRAFKKFIAFSYWISCIIGNTGLLVIVVSGFNLSSSNSLILALFLSAFLTYVNHVLRYETVANIEIVLTLLKFSLIIFCPIALFLCKPDLFSMPLPAGTNNDIIKIGVASFWVFLGLESAAVFGSGKEAKHGLLIGVSACFTLYLLTSFFIIGVVPAQELAASSAPFILLFHTAKLYALEPYIRFLVIFTSLGALYGWIAATSKMSYLFAKDGVFPSIFLKKTTSENSAAGLWTSSLLMCLLFVAVSFADGSKQFDIIANSCTYLTLVLYQICAYALWKNSKEKMAQVVAICGIILVLFGLVYSFLF